jgi:hypothetical protein
MHGLMSLREPFKHLPSTKPDHLVSMGIEQVKQMSPSFEGFDVFESWQRAESATQSKDDQE